MSLSVTRDGRDVRSADGDLAHVDGDQLPLWDELIVALPGVAASSGGDLSSLLDMQPSELRKSGE
jgi:hypothetical protein